MAQPILWCQHASKQRERVRIVKGKKVTEKVPQHGHDGKSDYDNPTLAKGQRVFWGMDSNGFEVRAPVSCGAADFDPAGRYGVYMKAKFRHFGWVHVSQCPVMLVKSGVLKPDHLVDQALLKEEPCEPGLYAPSREYPDRRCPHYHAEKKAREAANTAEQQRMAVATKSEIEKLVASQQAQTNEIVTALTQGFAALGQRVPAGGPPTGSVRGAEATDATQLSDGETNSEPKGDDE